MRWMRSSTRLFGDGWLGGGGCGCGGVADVTTMLSVGLAVGGLAADVNAFGGVAGVVGSMASKRLRMAGIVDDVAENSMLARLAVVLAFTFGAGVVFAASDLCVDIVISSEHSGGGDICACNFAAVAAGSTVATVKIASCDCAVIKAGGIGFATLVGSSMAARPGGNSGRLRAFMATAAAGGVAVMVMEHLGNSGTVDAAAAAATGDGLGWLLLDDVADGVVMGSAVMVVLCM